MVWGSLNGALAVILGAFGAHALKTRLLPEMMSVYQTGTDYHFLHALGLVAVGLAADRLPQTGLVKWSGWTMLAGIVIFCGSLYLLSLSGMRGFGAITPLGGAGLIGSWLLLAAALLKSE